MSSSFPYERREVLLDIQNISVTYDDKQILRGLNATIMNVVRPGMSQGQIVGLLGPSGIGKTTLFKVLSGILKPSTGQVIVGATGLPVTPGQVGVVAQSYPLLNHRTIKGNLVFAARQAGHRSAEADSLAMHMLDQFGMTEHSRKYPIQLSGGQRQRAAIAQQLLCSSHFVVMDEPFSGLDVVALSKVRKMLIDVSLQDEQNTFVIVTHDVTTAVSICDTIWLMGRERDAQGNIIPGARIMGVLDLIEMDIAWHDEPTALPQAIQLIRDIKHRFLEL